MSTISRVAVGKEQTETRHAKLDAKGRGVQLNKMQRMGRIQPPQKGGTESTYRRLEMGQRRQELGVRNTAARGGCGAGSQSRGCRKLKVCASFKYNGTAQSNLTGASKGPPWSLCEQQARTERERALSKLLQGFRRDMVGGERRWRW